jgi:hypothetical protein
VKKVKITVRVTIDRESFEGDFDSVEYEHIMDAVEQLGEDETLKFVNYAQNIKDRATARQKLITLHEGPARRRLQDARASAARKTHKIRPA